MLNLRFNYINLHISNYQNITEVSFIYGSTNTTDDWNKPNVYEIIIEPIVYLATGNDIYNGSNSIKTGKPVAIFSRICVYTPI